MRQLDGEVVGIHGVSVIRSGNLLLDGVDWGIGRGERWVLGVGAVAPGAATGGRGSSRGATATWPSGAPDVAPAAS